MEGSQRITTVSCLNRLEFGNLMGKSTYYALSDWYENDAILQFNPKIFLVLTLSDVFIELDLNIDPEFVGR
jgi:hypothetical protein